MGCNGSTRGLLNALQQQGRNGWGDRGYVCLFRDFLHPGCMQHVCLFLCVAAAGRDVTSGRLSSLETLYWKPTAVSVMFSGRSPIYCRNDTVGFGSGVQYGHWLAFFECPPLCLMDGFIPLTIHNTDRMSVSNTDLLFTKATWDTCNLHLHSE